MREPVDLFLLPPPPSLVAGLNGQMEILKRLLPMNVRRIVETLSPDHVYSFLLKDSLSGADSQEIPTFLLPQDPSRPYSEKDILLHCLRAVSERVADRNQVCILALSSLTLRNSQILPALANRAARSVSPVAVVHPIRRHPCVWWRIIEKPENFPRNLNYRMWRFELPGMWKMDYRGAEIISEKSGKALYRRQDFPRIYRISYALAAVRFQHLDHYFDAISQGRAKTFVLDPSDVLHCHDPLDLVYLEEFYSNMETSAPHGCNAAAAPPAEEAPRPRGSLP